MLDNLEGAGRIKRVRSEKDKRKIYVKLTKKNKSLQEKYLQVSNEMVNLFYDGFSDKEIDSIESYLKRLMKNLIESNENLIKKRKN